MSAFPAFVGRTADLLAYRGAAPGRGDVRLVAALTGPADGGLLVTGLEKLVQRVLIILLTRRGSVPYLLTLGTTFMVDAALGRWRTTAQVGLSFSAARVDLMRQLRAAQRASDPDDEVVGDVKLLGVSLDPDAVRLRILVTTRAGAATTFIQPIAVPARGPA